MNFADIIIAAAIILCLVLGVLWRRRSKREGNGCCNSCSDCGCGCGGKSKK